MASIKIDSKIVDWKLSDKQVAVNEPNGIHEGIQRPDVLSGSTYKVRSPHSLHAFYVTVNHHEVNGKLYPFEVFVNSKDMSSYQWIVALTRVLSAVFRKGGELQFLIEELKSVFDPAGGHFEKGKYVPSLIASIGGVIESHLRTIEFIPHSEPMTVAVEKSDHSALKNCSQCPSCSEFAVVVKEGCQTCMACGWSKCS